MKEQIIVAGIGPGGVSELTGGAREAFLAADVIIGAGRMLEDLQNVRKESGHSPAGGCSEGNRLDEQDKIYRREYRADQIAEYILQDLKRFPRRRYFIAVSGDSGFFSGAAGIREMMEKNGLSVKILPGISSLSYLCAKAGVSWQDAVCVSAHGRELCIASEVRRSRKTFVLTGGNAGALLKRLTDFGLGDVRVIAGERLSYEDENITEGSAFELAERSFDEPTSLLILNENARSGFCAGISDELFVRGKIPMTKREVRAVTMSHLNLQPEDIVYDIGAGTGSVTVEAALTAFRGQVFAVEKNPEAKELIEENCRKFSADNVKIVEGSAPAALKELPAPDAVFLGGTGGALDEILAALCGSPEAISGMSEEAEKSDVPDPCNAGDRTKLEPTLRIVMNAVSMESIGSAMTIFEKYGAQNLEAVQISAARMRKVGKYHLLNGQNPVFIISGDFKK